MKLFLLLISTFCYVCMALVIVPVVIGGTEKKMLLPDSLSGTTYTKGEYTGRELHLLSLNEPYHLEKRPEFSPQTPDGIAPPYEGDVRIFIMKGQQIIRLVKTLHDLQGSVFIDTPEKAIEFVRLRTSQQTYFLFRPEILTEVFKRPPGKLPQGIFGGACSPDVFEKHHLTNLTWVERDQFFEITRYVLSFLWGGFHSDDPVELYRMIERVYKDGGYLIVEKKLIVSEVDFSDIPYPRRILY